MDLIDALLNVRETLPFALEHIRDLAVDMPAITEATFRLQERIAALQARGIDVARLEFEASYGRTSMEYYDGFVFGFHELRSFLFQFFGHNRLGLVSTSSADETLKATTFAKPWDFIFTY